MIQSDRVSGVCVLLLGLALWLVLIPEGTERVDPEWVEPDTLPNLLAWILIALGALLALRPTGHVVGSGKDWIRFGLFFGLLALGLWAISFFGFMYAAPGLVAALMLATGERRATWLGLGVLGIPSVIWVSIVWLLDRSLPGGAYW